MKVSVALGMLVILSSPVWVSQTIATVRSVGENRKAITALGENVDELAETVGGMGEIFGRAEILGNGQAFTVSVNVHSEAGRYSRLGRQLLVTNIGSRREMSVTVTVAGNFEEESHLFLNLTRAAGRAIGANPGDEIQISIEPVPEALADD